MAKQRYGATERTTGAPEPSLSLEDGAAEGRPRGPGSKPAPGLYLVATPIGNLSDISHRAEAVLRQADLIACEDTRVTGKLLTLLGLSGRLTPYHEHNADKAGPALVERLREGKVVALVSDAGMPLVSDPGARLVKACRDEGLRVTSVPGPSAVLTALQLSGLASDRFLFGGFLPARSAARRQTARELAAVPATLIFFESPNRLPESLADLVAVLGPRDAVVARELTKLHEEVVSGTLASLAERYGADGAPKGEVVLVIGPPSAAEPVGEDDLDARLRAAMDGGASVKDAAALVAAETGHPRREVYARALRLAQGGGS